MKKIFPILLSICLCATIFFGCGAKPADYSGATFTVPEINVVEEKEKLVADLKQFVYGNAAIDIGPNVATDERILNRTAFSRGTENAEDAEGERAAAMRIKSILTGAGFADGDETTDRSAPYCVTQNFSLTRQERQNMFQVVEKEIYSQNVIAVVPAKKPRAGKILLTTHYDNSYGSDLLPGNKSHGVYESGIATAAVLRAAQLLADAELAYDVEFLFFGAGIPGNYGSAYYASKMTTAETDDTFLVMNFDLLGGGDYDYLYCDDVPTDHEEYLRAAATAADRQYERAPRDKKAFVAGDKNQYYRHMGLLSDHYAFYSKGINTALIAGFNWSNSDTYGVYESAEHPAILATSADTLYTVDAYYPDYASRAIGAVRTFLTSVASERFADAMSASRENRVSLAWLKGTTVAAGVYVGLAVLLFVLMFVIARALRTRNPMPKVTAPPPPEPEDVFGMPPDGPVNGQDGGTPAAPPDDGNPFEGY